VRERRLTVSDAQICFVFHELVRDPATEELRLVMELLGPSIDGFLRRPLPDPTLRDADCVIHRDIKSENNLVVDGLWAVKLCDFGMATSTSDLPPYEPAGTPAYREIPDEEVLAVLRVLARRGWGSCSRRSL
jgi:serine/threonine protein kinase